jgi:hypothetical protein
MNVKSKLLALFVVSSLSLPACREGGGWTETTAPPVSAHASAPAGSRSPAPAASPAGDPYVAHLESLRPRVPSGFTVVAERPFVVIGDEAPERVAMRAESTVRWAARQLRATYFDKDPTHVIDVWLFRDDTSYRHHAKALFGHDPSTPYGYYSPSARALVMNISTGGGTLVHEIVHPFVEADFPDCPAWLNEGLGSLYEQSAERDGKIVGLTNWRLAGLQGAIREGRFIPFSVLTAMGDGFYDGDSGLHYAEARYLAYYLQEEGLLATYYKAFRAGVARDPTGYETLQETLGRPDMARFEETWRAFVLALRFEP